MTLWQWTAPDGSVTNLSDWNLGSYVIGDGLEGLFAPTYDFATQQFAGVDGTSVQQINTQERTQSLPVDLVASDPVELRTRLRALAHVLRPRAGIGTLTALADDGSSRSLRCYYRKGLESGKYSATRFRAVLEFYAPSPWWRGMQLAANYGLAAPTVFFPIPPVTLSPSSVQGAQTFDLSDTDAPTYPLWTVSGPGTSLTLSNTFIRTQPDGTPATVTQQLVLNTSLTAAQSVTIDTRPGFQAVTRSDGVNLFGSLASDPAMWPLIDGVNNVSALLVGAGPTSRIALTADRLYSGAL